MNIHPYIMSTIILLLPWAQANAIDPCFDETTTLESHLSDCRVKAKQGVAQAQYNLGILYNYGKGVPRNYEKAFKWYKKAAKNGFPEAQYVLGRMYKKGLGVPKDEEKAAYWAKQGTINE